MSVAAPAAVGLAWIARYADDTTITGHLPEELPGAAVPRPGMTRFDLLQGNHDSGWTPILAVDLAEHERLVFRRRMQSSLLGGPASAVGLIVGSYDTRSDVCSLVYLHGDGTMSLRCDLADVRPEPHEVG